MGIKAWIVYGVICIVVVVAVLLGMLILVPQAQYIGTQTEGYQNIAKQDYTFSASISELEKEYSVTESAVEKDKKADKYEEGNINPFTPPKEVTIYNEPTLKYEGSNTLTPDMK